MGTRATSTILKHAKAIIGEEQWRTAVRRANQCDRERPRAPPRSSRAAPPGGGGVRGYTFARRLLMRRARD